MQLSYLHYLHKIANLICTIYTIYLATLFALFTLSSSPYVCYFYAIEPTLFALFALSRCRNLIEILNFSDADKITTKNYKFEGPESETANLQTE